MKKAKRKTHKGKRNAPALRKSRKMVDAELLVKQIVPRRIDISTFDYQKPARRT